MTKQELVDILDLYDEHGEFDFMIEWGTEDLVEFLELIGVLKL